MSAWAHGGECAPAPLQHPGGGFAPLNPLPQPGRGRKPPIHLNAVFWEEPRPQLDKATVDTPGMSTPGHSWPQALP